MLELTPLPKLGTPTLGFPVPASQALKTILK
jgi:hypothetical protein